MPVLDVAGDVEARIRELITRHRPELEEIVDAELERQLDALVVERIRIRNGNGADDRDRDRDHGHLDRLCDVCRAEPRLPGRSIGRSCRSKRDRERRARRRDGEELPRPSEDELSDDGSEPIQARPQEPV